METKMNRKSILKSAGVTLLLPNLLSAGAILTPPKKRLFTVVNHLSFYQPALIPKTEGRNYEQTALLSPFKDLPLSIFSQLDNPGVQLGNGHTPSVGILSGFFNVLDRKNKISFDQIAANHLGTETRFESICLQAGTNLNFSQVCWNRDGLPVYQESSPEKAFQKLFGIEQSQAIQNQRLIKEKSILDMVSAQAKVFQKSLNQEDKQKLDEYFTSIREVEKKLLKEKYWVNRDKPKTNYKPENFPILALDHYLQTMLDIAKLALQTDSTRVVTLQIPFWEYFELEDKKDHYHHLSHHGMKEDKVTKLLNIESMIMSKISKLYQDFCEIKMGSSSLLDETTCLITAPMGSANAHDFNRLPAIIAGGNYKHGRNIFTNGKPINSLYLRLLKDLDVPINSFNHEKSTLEIS